jgi:hypothetical protein
LKWPFKAKLGQLWFPREFRLSKPEFDEEQLDMLEDLIRIIRPNPSRPEADDIDEKR